MTADDAARVAARAGARRAVLVHIQPPVHGRGYGKFVDAAKKRFENTEIGSDLPAIHDSLPGRGFKPPPKELTHSCVPSCKFRLTNFHKIGIFQPVIHRVVV